MAWRSSSISAASLESDFTVSMAALGLAGSAVLTALASARFDVYARDKRVGSNRNGKGQGQLGQAVLVGRIGVRDVRLGFLELGLGEFHDGAEAEGVAGLCQI